MYKVAVKTFVILQNNPGIMVHTKNIKQQKLVFKKIKTIIKK